MAGGIDFHTGEVITTSDSPEGVAFLTALLVRYREIGSARLYQTGHLLRIDFYLHRQLQPEEWSDFRERLLLSWKVFFQLQRLAPKVYDVASGSAPYHEMPFLVDEDELVEVGSVTVIRDLASVSLEELALVISLINLFFEDSLALNEEAPHEDAEHQDEVIYRCLERVRAVPGDAILTGFRDDMRVLIYSSQEEH